MSEAFVLGVDIGGTKVAAGLVNAVSGWTENLVLSFDSLPAFENAVNGCSTNLDADSEDARAGTLAAD